MSSLPFKAPRLQVTNTEHDAVREGRTRIRIGAATFALALAIAGLRLGEVALFTPDASALVLPDAVTAERADITDRNGELLATTLETYSLYAEPGRVWDAEEAARAIVGARPHLDRAKIASELASDKAFVWIERGLTPREKQEVFELGQPGLGFRTEPKRTYPAGRLAAHVLGFTDVDMIGVAGAERAFEERLSAPGAPAVALSLDMGVQHALTEELAAGLAKFEAETIAGVVLDVKSGEILAMASLPDFDPNHPGKVPAKSRYNHAAMSTYELGSVFKPLTLALALETRTSTETELFPVQDKLVVNRKSVRDDHPSKVPLAMPDILAESSNRGTGIMALRAGADAQRRFLAGLGLFDRVPYELAESARPLVQERWPDITTVTVGYGHGIGVTPLALLSAVGSVFNNGIRVEPTILKRSAANAPVVRRAMSREVARSVAGMMRYTVTDGTGRNADVEGYGVMGKTGTADKPSRGGYDEGNLVTSFVAGFPYENPHYAVIVTFDEPKAIEGTYGYATAGWNAAPTAGNVIARIAPLLGVEKRPVSQTLSPYRKAEP